MSHDRTSCFTNTYDRAKMALIPNGGKLHTKSAVQKALGAEVGVGYKCSSNASVN